MLTPQMQCSLPLLARLSFSEVHSSTNTLITLDLALSTSLITSILLHLNLLRDRLVVISAAFISTSGRRLGLALRACTLLGGGVRWSDQPLLTFLSRRRSGLSLCSSLLALAFALRSGGGLVSFGRLWLWSSIAFLASLTRGLFWSAPFGEAVGDGLWGAVCYIVNMFSQPNEMK